MTGVFLRIVGVVQLAVVAVALVVVFGDTQDAVQRALGDHGETAALVIVIGAAVAAVVALVFAIGSLVIAGPAGRGSRPARVTGSVLCLLLIAWTAGVLVANLDGGPLSLFAAAADTNGAMSTADFQARINDALPDWFRPANLGLGIASAVSALLALVSLVAKKR